MFPRPNKFDSYLCEPGPHPVKLSDGNYFFIYNSAKIIHPPDWRPDYDREYNAGYLILDHDNPTEWLERSD